MKRFFSGLLTCALLLGLLPTAARAADDVPYLDRHWDESTKQVITEGKYVSNPTAVTNSDAVWGTEGTTTWYVASGNVTIGQNDPRYFKRVTVTGDVRLILTDGSTLTVYGGIHVADDDGDIMNGSANGLTIYGQQNGTGTLTAQVIQQANSQDNGEFAGIGGNKYEHGGAITINGGTVNATGGMWAVGIGGGDAADTGTNGSGGNIIINGGTVTAVCLEAPGLPYGAGAGIGGGSNGAGGNITINGGTVTATGQKKQYGGAGIGGCRSGNGGTITINGGIVTATGGKNSAGIGGGSALDRGDGAGGTITITGGIVNATGGGNGAGIGGGGSTRDGKAGAGGTITITGGTVNAAGGSGAGIGSGVNKNGSAGDSGTFSTETNGNAFILASSISDNADKTGWSGVIFEGNNGKVYGRPTLAADVEIPSNKTLTIPDGSRLTIGNGVTLTNNGTIIVEDVSTLINEGTIDNNNGTITNNGAIMNNGIIAGTVDGNPPHSHNWDAGWNSDTTHHWHVCTGEGECPLPDSEKDGYAAHSGGTATCAAQAVCTVCGVSYGDTNSSNHTGGTEIRNQKEATASEAGYTGDTYCLGCGMKIADGEVILIPTYPVTVNCGTGGGSYAESDTVTITATVPDGQRFTGWTVNAGGVTLANASSATTTFTMPAQAVTITANFQSNSGGGNSGGGGGDSYTPPTYKPDVSKPSGGGGAAPTVSPSNPKQGDTVTVTLKPDDGYEVEKITVTDKGGNNVPVTKKPNGTYTFTQPGGRVTIEIEYAPVPLTDRPWNNPFTDVSEGDWYYEALRFVQERGLMNGYSDGRFGPNDTLSRAQLAQILFNKEGRPVVVGGDFNDVDSGAWYADAVTWAAANGIVGGYGDGRFGPNDPITREQLAVMLWRYSGSPAATDKERHFNDVDEISPFALEALRWVVENGVLNGYGDGRLGPREQATRAQVAQMLKNFIENQEENT